MSGPDNRQYLAVVAGLSGGGAVGDPDIDMRDLTAANGFANALPDLPRSRRNRRAALCLPLAMRAMACCALGSP